MSYGAVDGLAGGVDTCVVGWFQPAGLWVALGTIATGDSE